MNKPTPVRELTWELATGKPPIEGMRLDTVMAFYHNDQEKGFGVGLDGRPPDIDLEAIVHDAFNHYKAAWDAADERKRSEMLEDCLTQVEYEAARERGSRGEAGSALLLIMNVIWLSSYGFMPNDEYNGAQFFWTGGAPLPPRSPEEFAPISD